MKKISLVLAVLLAAAFVMTGCNLAEVDGEEGAARFTFNGVTYNRVTSSDALAYGELATKYLADFTPRTNSSGLSVPSNSHTFSFAELNGVYFFWTGNGQNREFFAVVEDSVWEDYCWIGVTTQQGPFGYLYHPLYAEDGPAFVFEKKHNNITQAWLDGAKAHNWCQGICDGPCAPCGNCLDCDDCDCECDCVDLPPPCPGCWNGRCCTVFNIPNSTGSHGLGANPHGYTYTISQISGNDPRVEFNLFDDWFDVFDNVVRIRGQGTWYEVVLEPGVLNQTVRIPANNTTHVEIRHIPAGK